MTGQLPSESSVLDIPLPGTAEYVAASNSINEDKIIIAKKAAKKKKVKKKVAKKKA